MCRDALDLGGHVAEAMGQRALAGGSGRGGGVAGRGYRRFFGGERGGYCPLRGRSGRFVC